MAYLGVKLGRHSIQTSRWNGEVAVEAAMPRLQRGATWRPVLAFDLERNPQWGHAVWQQVAQLSLAPCSLPEHLAEEHAQVTSWLPDPRPLLAATLFHQLEEIGSNAMREEGRHVLCVASTSPVTPRLRELLPKMAGGRLDLAPERVLDVSACALAGVRQQVREVVPLNGPVLHAHLGGREAQVHLWETEGAPSLQVLHRVARLAAPGASLGAVLRAVYDRLTGEWGHLRVVETALEEAVAKIRRHVLHCLAEQRAQWTRSWHYQVPEGYGEEAQWLSPGTVAFPEPEVEAILAAAGDSLMETVERALAAGGIRKEQLAAFVATGAGATPAYLRPRLEREFEGFPLASRPEIVPALGAARAAWFNGSPESGHRIEVREGLNIGAELGDGSFDVLISARDAQWGESVRVYDVPEGVTSVRLLAGIRRANRELPELASVPLPPETRGPAAAVLRVWRQEDAWWAEAARRGGGAGGGRVRLSLPAEQAPAWGEGKGGA